VKCAVCGHEIVMDAGDEVKHVVKFVLGKPLVDKVCFCGCKTPRMKGSVRL